MIPFLIISALVTPPAIVILGITHPPEGVDPEEHTKIMLKAMVRRPAFWIGSVYATGIFTWIIAAGGF